MSKRPASIEYKRKLTNDFLLAENQEPEIQAMMARYLCVRVTGYVEVFVKERIQSFVEDRKSHKVIISYIQADIKNKTNLNNQKMVELLKSFSSDWADYYERNVTEAMKSSLGSVYTLRNNIAHGGNDSLSLNLLKKHFANIESLLKIIDESIAKYVNN